MGKDNEDGGGFLPDEIDTTGLAAEVVAFIEEARKGIDESDDDVELSIVSRMLTATDATAILADNGVTKLADIVGHNVVIRGYEWRRSSVGGGKGAYMLLQAQREDSDAVEVVSCGAKSVMAQVFALNRQQLLPLTVFVKKADKPTSNGYYPIRLLPAEAGF